MRTLARIVFVVAASLPAACRDRASGADAGNEAAASASAGDAPAADALSSPTCLTTTDVSSALGFAVRDLTRGTRRYGDMWTCGFEAADPALAGVTVTATVSPAAEAEQRFAKMREDVHAARGGKGEPDVIPAGERGMAYGTTSGSMAAAVKGGRLYLVEAHFGMAKVTGDKKDGTVALLRKLIGS